MIEKLIRSTQQSGNLICLIILKLILGAVDISTALVFRDFILMISEQKDIYFAYEYVIKSILLLVLSSGLRCIITNITNKVRRQYSLIIRSKVLQKMEKRVNAPLPLKELLFDYVKESELGFVCCVDLAVDIICCISYWFLMLQQSFLLSMIAFFFIPIIAVNLNAIYKKMQVYDNSYKKIYVDYQSHMNIILSDVIQIKAENAQEYVAKKFTEKWLNLNELIKKRFLLWYLEITSTEINEKIIANVMMLGIGCYLASIGVIEIAGLIVIMNYHESLIAYIKEINKKCLDFVGINNAYRNIADMLIHGKEQNFCEMEQTYDKCTLVVNDLRFSYGEKLVIKNASISFNEPGIYVIEGKSGAGKTTLAKLFAGELYTKVGNLYVNNKKITECDYQYVRNYVSAEFNDFKLFDMTLHENILLGEKWSGLKYKEIIEKLELQNLDDGKSIGENGNMLSAGERQKVALARQIVKNAAIYVFDEIFSNLDVESFDTVFSILKDLAKQKIIIVISHNKKVLSCADKIITVRDGEIS